MIGGEEVGTVLSAATPDQKFKSSHKLCTPNISLNWNGSLGYESSPMVSLYLEVKFTMMLCHDCWPSSKYKGECYFHPKLFLQLPWIVSALELRRTWGDWTWALQACLVTHHVYFWLESSCDIAAKIAAIVGKEQDVRAIVQFHPSFVEASDYEGKLNT